MAALGTAPGALPEEEDVEKGQFGAAFKDAVFLSNAEVAVLLAAGAEETTRRSNPCVPRWAAGAAVSAHCVPACASTGCK